MTGTLSSSGLFFTTVGEGPPALLLLGLGGRLEFAEPILRGLRSAHRVLAFDYPGLGRSTAPAPSDISGHAALLPALLDEAKLPRVHVVGISFGVPLALSLAAAHPERVDRLALVSGAARADARFRRVTAVLADAARSQSPESIARLAVVLLFPPSFDQGREALLEALERGLIPDPADLGAFAHQADIAGALDLTSELPRVHAPAKIWIGGADAFVSRTLAEELHAALSGSTLEVVPGAGHSLLAERPRATYASLLSFLAERSGPPAGAAG